MATVGSPAMRRLLDLVGGLRSLDMAPLLQTFQAIAEALQSFHKEQVRDSITEFADGAKEETDKLIGMLQHDKLGAKLHAQVGYTIVADAEESAGFGGLVSLGKEARGAAASDAYEFGDFSR